jgi:integrase
MAKLKMTDAVVKQTTAQPGERVDYFDAHPRDRQRGLVLRVSGAREKDGCEKVTRTWAVFCRVKGSKTLRRFTIGPYPETSLGEARDKAAEIIKGARREGADPLRERKEAERAAELIGRDTISALVERFMADMAERPKRKGGKRSRRYVEETQRNFNNHVLPRWSAKNVHEITRRDVNDLVSEIAKHGSDVKDADGKKRHVAGGKIAANRVLAAVRSFFTWALKAGIVETTPAAMVDPPGEEIARERTLSDDEIRVIWPAIKALGYPFAAFFMLALATGQRRDEVAKMEWAEIDEKNRTWTIPKEKTKAKRAHVVPLSQLALDIIADAKAAAKALAKARADAARLDRIPELPAFVLSTRANRAISGYSAAKADLDEKVAAALKKARAKKIEPWTIHDLRRTCATGIANLGVVPHVVECVLNHVSGFRSGVAGVYNLSAYLPQMRDALDKWAEHLSELAKPRAVDDARGAA